MKARCRNCGEIFEYEENKGVCPACKRYNSLRKEEPQKQKATNKELKNASSIDKEETKKINDKKIENKSSKNTSKTTDKKKVLTKNDVEIVRKKEVIDIQDDARDEKNKKMLYALIAALVIIFILPTISFILNDDTELIGHEGYNLMQEDRSVSIDGSEMNQLVIRKIGYTQKKNYMYIEYETNLESLAENGYEIFFSVIDDNGIRDIKPTKYQRVVLKHGKDENGVEEADTYYTKCIFDYTMPETRIKGLKVLSQQVYYDGENRIIESQSSQEIRL